MTLPAIGFLLIVPSSAGLGVHVEQVVDLSLGDATSIATVLGDAIGLRTGRPVEVDDPLAPPCGLPTRCLGEVAARTHAGELIYLRLIGGVTKIRVVAERLNRAGQKVTEATVNLAVDRRDWPTSLDRLARRLFPEALGSPPGVVRGAVGRPATAEPGVARATGPSGIERAAPWLLIGLGVATGVAGTVLGRSASSARDSIETLRLSDDEYVDTLDRMRSHGTAANVLFGVAAGSALTGLVWLLVR